MAPRYTLDELKNMSSDAKDVLIISLQDSIDALNENIEKLIEQVRIANQYRFGRHTETLKAIDGQLSMFDEAEEVFDETAPEPDIEDTVPEIKKRSKTKGKRDADLKDFPEEDFPHDVSTETLDAFYGAGNWKSMPDETYKRLRYQPATWLVEKHIVKVYVGTDGDHQDEFMRGDRPKDILRNSILTPSLAAAILNGKYVNALPYDRMEKEFERNGVNITKQNMANWTINIANRYFAPLCERMRQHLLAYHVTQSDETPCQVIHDGGHPGSKSYMWVHRSGELYRDRPIVLYEYQKGRDHHIPMEYYKDFKGVLVTDGLSQYHLIEKQLNGLINANCWVHARRDFADAVKASKDPKLAKQSIAYQALVRMGAIFDLDGSLKDLSSEERLKERQSSVAPLVDEFFAWVKQQLSSMLPKGKTADGLNYCINQEKYLRVFLTDGDVPMDNSAAERSIRPFCIGKKNWMFFDSIRGAKASATVYSVSETAKLNNLRPYKYFEYLLTELPKLCDRNGNIDSSKLDAYMPWSSGLPDECRKPRT